MSNGQSQSPRRNNTAQPLVVGMADRSAGVMTEVRPLISEGRGRGFRSTLLVAALAGAVLTPLIGCSFGGGESIESAVKPSGTRLTPTDFVASNVVQAAPTPALMPAPAEVSLDIGSAQTAEMLELGGVPFDANGVGNSGSPQPSATYTATYTTTAGAPLLEDARATPVGEPVFIDAKVGDINGKPIFASTFFDRGTLTLEPLGPRLREEARRMKPAEWREFARKEINRALDSLIEDELLRAEALANLTPEQKQGFFAFLERIQKETVSQSGGSREKANEALMESEGMDLATYMSQRSQAELIRYQLSEKIFQRVQVSRRDIELAYARYNDQFNPPPQYLFRIVAVRGDNPDAVATMQARIDSGESFEEIAKSELNTYKRAEGGLEARELKGELAKVSWFGSAALNDAAKTLTPGTTAGPITFGSGQAWLHLDSIEEKKISLYEAQTVIENGLRNERAEMERRRYIAKLRSRASIGDTEETARRLLEIAESRYLVAGL